MPKTITFDVEANVGWLTLNRPDVMNAFNIAMQREIKELWADLRTRQDVNCVVLTGAGDKAFCTGIDRDETFSLPRDQRTVGAQGGTPYHFNDPGDWLGPKSNDCWIPVIAAVNGIACGGAFYMLGESDIIVASDNATFFDPHVTYGMAAVYETIHMFPKVPFGELLRMQLVGAQERLSAQKALDIGLVSEVVSSGELHDAARRLALAIASQPRLAVQATLRSAWAALQLGRDQALKQAPAYIASGTSDQALAEGQERFASGQRVEWRLR